MRIRPPPCGPGSRGRRNGVRSGRTPPTRLLASWMPASQPISSLAFGGGCPPEKHYPRSTNHMSSEVVPIREGLRLPALIERAGPRTLLRFVEFFTVHIANANTRQAYTRALQSFLGWCQQQGVNAIAGVQPLHVAGYREVLRLQGYSVPTVK